jgi:hypothetical protein
VQRSGGLKIAPHVFFVWWRRSKAGNRGSKYPGRRMGVGVYVACVVVFLMHP